MKYVRLLSIAFWASSLLLNACGSSTHSPSEFSNDKSSDVSAQSSLALHHQLNEIDTDLETFLDAAEANASPDGLIVLKTARTMIANGVIVKGSCWDYIDQLYKNVNVVGKNRDTTFNSSKNGPFAAPAEIRSGDWLYFINHSYGDVEHSGVFIAWLEIDTKEALVMSYPGGNQNRPARYSSYELSNVYHVMRPKEGSAKPLIVSQ